MTSNGSGNQDFVATPSEYISSPENNSISHKDNPETYPSSSPQQSTFKRSSPDRRIQLRQNPGNQLPQDQDRHILTVIELVDYQSGGGGVQGYDRFAIGVDNNRINENASAYFDSKHNAVTIRSNSVNLSNKEISESYLSPDGELLVIRTKGDGKWYLLAIPDESGRKWGGKYPKAIYHTWQEDYADAWRTGDYYVLNNSDYNHGRFEPCYLKGALIETPEGHILVEEICPGQYVSVFENGKNYPAMVIWTGSGSAHAKPGLPDDMASYPVRIIKDALAPDVPSKDLLVTPEHCLYLEGGFIPVRMLVNNRSIFYDKKITEYRFYHFKTEKHSIVRANNLLTETFLDTGNHDGFFSNMESAPGIPNISPLSKNNCAENIQKFLSFIVRSEQDTARSTKIFR